MDGLVARLKGEVFTPQDAGYERELAGFNRIGQHRPDVIVAAQSAGDVSAAVSFAAREALPVAVQATGHGIAASAPGGVLVSTRRMNAVAVDPLTRTAHVEAGAQWHQVIAHAAGRTAWHRSTGRRRWSASWATRWGAGSVRWAASTGSRRTM